MTIVNKINIIIFKMNVREKNNFNFKKENNNGNTKNMNYY